MACEDEESPPNLLRSAISMHHAPTTHLFPALSDMPHYTGHGGPTR
jgi:hypothetical protein